jgi:hypothetical protein
MLSGISLRDIRSYGYLDIVFQHSFNKGHEEDNLEKNSNKNN